MSNNTTCFISENFSFPCGLKDGESGNYEIYFYTILTSNAIILVLVPVAVTGNALILAAMWKKSFQKTPFYILLSGLALADLCTGLTSPLVAVPFLLMHLGKLSVFLNSTLTIGIAITVYLVALTLLIITFMSVERWLHMSRRSLVTSRRGVFTAAMLSLVPIALVVLSTLHSIKGTLEQEVNIAIGVYMLCCYFTTSVAYFKVYRIIRQHQQQIQRNQPCQNFGQPAINFAKYKKSVVSILYIFALLSFCFLPMIVLLLVAAIQMGYITETWTVSLLLLFLSSSLNPSLYIWTMKDVRVGVKKLFCTNG